ncbi:sulfite (NADPH) reductase flavoprotein [Oceanobacillus iheyensis HTE831]|uniref:assimilatory sulfite reductase (NADPH) n=1 Tax=Oceanobacillus iheyensis (strain DSM 14371 / CIP 107618 / JCM 11309 / KCTC 3954 / HTE831) TaxID=221109 RepID=Q8EQP1_OCEIH|nr:assimilatory sulfite reductase (NADPH) flavoprotein subunit [Oceanobacillus iheyensis]BAC13609.1 sulfite (NADPH) reductase flavoprotein [Oceanobacillus iheyensis HTE831]
MLLQETNSPFNKEQSDYLNKLLPTLTESQRIWLSGYLSAKQLADSDTKAQQSTNPILAHEQSLKPVNETKLRDVTILYGSETGNGETIAKDLGEKVESRDFKVTISSMDNFKAKDLKKVQDIFIITATHGEGDPPENAISFHEFLHGRKAPKLKDVRFSVLSLGDQSYEFFCQTGKEFDNRLEELGGDRLYPRVDCDVDFDDLAAEWIDGVLHELSKAKSAHDPELSETSTEIDTEGPVYSRTNPFHAEVLENLNLNGEGSNKETYHMELSIEDANFEFEIGDSLGIYPKNNPDMVEQLITGLNFEPEGSVSINKQGERRSLREALLTNFEISRITKPLLEKAAQYFNNNNLKDLVTPEKVEEQKAYIQGRDVIDLITDYPPVDMTPEEFIQILRKMPARLYSISSSFRANPDEVHITVAKAIYTGNRQEQAGVCSGQCAERVTPGDLLPIYIHRNPNFKFPNDVDTPVIMIGPGTGVAPYRSLLEEREEIGANGRTWLFYGDQHFATDFLYQVEWQNWLKKGVLTKMDVAFSRDSADKVYVQHRMLEHSKELFQWLQDGANIYVCGDEKYMANDVHQMLSTIIQKEGRYSFEEAEAYLTDMRKQKRYQRDVY